MLLDCKFTKEQLQKDKSKILEAITMYNEGRRVEKYPLAKEVFIILLNKCSTLSQIISMHPQIAWPNIALSISLNVPSVQPAPKTDQLSNHSF